MNTNINYQILEGILQDLSYSSEKIHEFRNRFFEELFKRVGAGLLTPLKQEQKEEFVKILVAETPSEKYMSEFLAKNNLSSLEENFQNAFDELFLETVEKILKLAPKAKKGLVLKKIPS